jgi:hypothetical protein
MRILMTRLALERIEAEAVFLVATLARDFRMGTLQRESSLVVVDHGELPAIRGVAGGALAPGKLAAMGILVT